MMGNILVGKSSLWMVYDRGTMRLWKLLPTKLDSYVTNIVIGDQEFKLNI